MRKVFAPGCALLLYKPQLAEKLYAFLSKDGCDGMHLTCCRHESGITEPTLIINTCPGCDRRFREAGGSILTASLWEVLLNDEHFPFPDYHGAEMAIQDACPTRSEARVYTSVRQLAEKMNIVIKEPKYTKSLARCCGDSFYGTLTDVQLEACMIERAKQMPCEDVLVYCVSCIKAIHIGGKTPRYLVDLLFGEATSPDVYDPKLWHELLQQFIDQH